MRISDWSSDVCSSDLRLVRCPAMVTERLRSRPPLRAAGSVASPLIPWNSSLGRDHVRGIEQALELLGLHQPERGCGLAQAGAFGISLLRHLGGVVVADLRIRSEEHTAELQSLMSI